VTINIATQSFETPSRNSKRLLSEVWW